MVLYGITLVPLAEELWANEPGILTPIYMYDTALDESARRRSQILSLIMEMGPDRRYLPKPAKSLFITDLLDQEEEAKREFAEEGLNLNFVGVLHSEWYK